MFRIYSISPLQEVTNKYIFKRRPGFNRVAFRLKSGRAFSTSAENLFHVEALFETIHTAAGINQLLLAGIERMALGADINLHLFLGGAGFKSFTAYAANHALSILGMNVFLHCFFTSFAYAMAVKPQVI